jgi:hypothetical protein
VQHQDGHRKRNPAARRGQCKQRIGDPDGPFEEVVGVPGVAPQPGIADLATAVGVARTPPVAGQRALSRNPGPRRLHRPFKACQRASVHATKQQDQNIQPPWNRKKARNWR